MVKKLSVKIVVILIAVMVVIMALTTLYFVRSRTANMEAELLGKGRILALGGAKVMERILSEKLASGGLSEGDLFDENYERIPATDPPKYHTRYDTYLDKAIVGIQDELLKDDQVVFAVLVDRNGYLPTHNTKYSRPLSGNREQDKLWNRTKRIFNDPVGLAAARNTAEYFKQDYNRDTGERMWDISAPVHVNGRHWGAFRIGFSMEKTERKVAELRRQIIGAMALMLIASTLTIILVVTLLIRPLNRLTATARRIADGNLEEQIPVVSNDEIGKVAEAFNRMTSVIVRNLRSEIDRSRRLFDSVREAISHLAGSAGQLMSISAQQAAGATEQATSVHQVSATSEEIAATARQISANATTVERLADDTAQRCVAGSGAVSDAIGGMESLKGQVEGIARSMLHLGDNSQKIGGIVEIIDEISDQTNLLALNAAIEAAGAGEAGKRFAIVAKEVRRLAERTVEATAQIRELIQEIQKATNSTIMVTEEGIKGVEGASALVDRVQDSFGQIIAMVEETARAAKEITNSTQQQTSACDEMATTMNEVREVARQTADSARAIETAISDIRALSEGLQKHLEEEIQAKGREAARAGSSLMERVLEEAVASGRVTLDELFDERYVPIPGTDPQKFHTRYDAYMDETIQAPEDHFLEDSHVIYAVLVDRNGYLPTHNSKFSRPLTGDREQDKHWNRTKRKFDDPVGLAAASNTVDILVQVYQRDTGDKIWDISYPVRLRGRHWGAFRIGYSM